MRLPHTALFIFALLSFTQNTFANNFYNQLIKDSKKFLENGYSLEQPKTPQDLVRYWQQIEGIDRLVFLYKDEDKNIFYKTGAKPHMIHDWLRVRIMPDAYLNGDDMVNVLYQMISSYKYILDKRLKDDDQGKGYRGGEYAEITSLVKNSGETIARIVDKKYANGTLLPPKSRCLTLTSDC